MDGSVVWARDPRLNKWITELFSSHEFIPGGVFWADVTNCFRHVLPWFYCHGRLTSVLYGKINVFIHKWLLSGYGFYSHRKRSKITFAHVLAENLFFLLSWELSLVFIFKHIPHPKAREREKIDHNNCIFYLPARILTLSFSPELRQSNVTHVWITQFLYVKAYLSFNYPRWVLHTLPMFQKWMGTHDNVRDGVVFSPLWT